MSGLWNSPGMYAELWFVQLDVPRYPTATPSLLSKRRAVAKEVV
jgi:hypothetical protein